MHVRHLQSGDQHAHPRGVEGVLTARPTFCATSDRWVKVAVSICSQVDLLARDHQHITQGDGFDGEECDGLAVLPHELRGDRR